FSGLRLKAGLSRIDVSGPNIPEIIVDNPSPSKALRKAYFFILLRHRNEKRERT
ncbi:hypothetical protein Q604_UNBC12026G0002, partial [human gut metagenome]